jgi:hypothetical protein
MGFYSKGIMKNFENYFKKEKGMKVLFLFGVVFLISIPCYAGSIKEITQSIKQVQSIETISISSF